MNIKNWIILSLLFISYTQNFDNLKNFSNSQNSKNCENINFQNQKKNPSFLIKIFEKKISENFSENLKNEISIIYQDYQFSKYSYIFKINNFLENFFIFIQFSEINNSITNFLILKNLEKIKNFFFFKNNFITFSKKCNDLKCIFSKKCQNYQNCQNCSNCQNCQKQNFFKNENCEFIPNLGNPVKLINKIIELSKNWFFLNFKFSINLIFQKNENLLIFQIFEKTKKFGKNKKYLGINYKNNKIEKFYYSENLQKINNFFF